MSEILTDFESDGENISIRAVKCALLSPKDNETLNWILKKKKRDGIQLELTSDERRVWNEYLNGQAKKEGRRPEAVDHPTHYNAGKIEVIEMIEDQGLSEGFCLGNAVKYIMRAGKKDPAKRIEDLKKARWYLDRFITFLERA